MIWTDLVYSGLDISSTEWSWEETCIMFELLFGSQGRFSSGLFLPQEVITGWSSQKGGVRCRIRAYAAWAAELVCCETVLLLLWSKTGHISPTSHHPARQLCSCSSFHLFLLTNAHFRCPILFSSQYCIIIRHIVICILSAWNNYSKGCLNNIWQNMYIQDNPSVFLK